MRTLTLIAAVVLSPIPAIAGDESAGPPPAVAQGALRPPAPSRPEAAPAAAAATLDEDRIAQIVDAAVERALARRQPAAQAGPAGGWTPPASASPQGWAPAALPAREAVTYRVVRAEPVRRVGFTPTLGEDRQYVDVLVPACWPKRAVGALGERLAECGRPSVRRMRVAPTEVVEVRAPAAAPRPVYASSQE